MALNPAAYITDGQPDGPFCWVDVTSSFFKSVKDLRTGELVHDELFGLFEAMSAIEMMDPKMDAGMQCNRGETSSRKPLNFEQALKAGKLKLADISHSELISIIDASMCCLVTWLEGHSLAQTLFINLYLHQPHQIEDKVLKAFCTVMLHIVDIIKDFVNKAMVFEEEDFQPVLYGYRVNYEISEQKAMSCIKDAEEEVHKAVKSTRAKGGNEDRDESTLKKHQAATALHVRLKFTRLFMQSLSLGKKGGGSVEEITRCLNSASEALRVWKTSCDALAPCDVNNIMGFEPMINQRLLPPTFPRYTRIMELVETIDYLEDLLGRLKNICNITHCTNFRLALDFFNEFARTSPCVLSRSVLQLLYLPLSNRVLNQANMADVLRDAAKLFISPPSLAPKSPVLQYPQAKECLDGFFQHCVRPFGSLVQIAGHNLARQRDKLAHVLEDFAALQEEADKVDAFFHTLSLKSDNPRPHLACLGTWVLFYTLRIMVHYLLLGFELGLYSKHEYHYIYWYLYEFLYGWLISAYSRADGFLVEQEALESIAKAGRGGNKKVSGGSKSKKNKKNHPYNREIILHQAIQNMCGGFYKACAGFYMDGKIKGPNPEFGSEHVRYDHRFAPFSAVLTPPPVQYAQFRDMTSLGVDVGKYHPAPTIMALYLAACKHFHQARTLLETITADQEVQDMLKVCKTNFVVMKLLAGGHKKDSQSPPEFDFTAHRHFPLIKIT